MATPVNGIYVLQGVDPAQIASAPVGVKVVEIYDDNNTLFTTDQVAQMENNGAGPEVLGYFSIGEAENYRSYFSSLPSSVLGPRDPSWPGDYQVAYWTPTWLAVAENYIQTMINQGYNGAFFDVVDEAETSWAKKNAPANQGGAEGAMVTLIQELTQFAQAQNPNFQIWINSSGAEPMLANPALVSTVNGAFEEELFYKNSGKPQTPANVSYNLGFLDDLLNAGKPVVAIEYVTGAATVAAVQADAAAWGLGYYIANPNLQLDGVDTEGFTPAGGAAAVTPAPPTLTLGPPPPPVTGGGGSVPLNISVTAPPSATAVTVTIKGLKSYETITDALDGSHFSGTVKLTPQQVNSGLTLTSNYQGTGHPITTLTITASDTMAGVNLVSAPVTISITDPPPSGSGAGQGGHALTSSAAAALLDQNAGHFTGNAALSGDHTVSGPDIAAGADGFKESSGSQG